MRWPNGPICPACGTGALLPQDSEALEVQEVREAILRQVGTIFEDSPIPLDKWLAALWMLVNCKNGISSYEVGRDLGLTQKSAWFMLHRLRLALQENSLVKLGGLVKTSKWTRLSSAGRLGNMHKHVRERANHCALADKIRPLVFGILERGGKVRT